MFASILLRLGGRYSLREGERVYWEVRTTYSPQAIAAGLWLTLPQRALQIAAHLRQKGIAGASAKIEDNVSEIIIPTQGKETPLEILLGPLNTEGAAYLYADVDGKYDESIARPIGPMMDSDGLPADMDILLAHFGQFQRVVSHAVDVFYGALDLTPPNVVLSLSKQFEQK